jgi:hypothetical protein
MLVIHHWDTDGICSAAKIMNLFGDASNMTPPIGDFNLDDRIRKAISEEKGRSFVLDLNLGKGKDAFNERTTFIDHHFPQTRIAGIEHINPVMDGKPSANYPSCTTVVSETYGSWDHLSALGAFGDVGKKAMEHPMIRKVQEDSGHTIDDFLTAQALIDTNYVMMDRNAVEASVRSVHSMAEILGNERWQSNRVLIKQAIGDALSHLTVDNDVAVIDFKSHYNIISKVTRRAVWDMGHWAAVVSNRDFPGKAQTYLRVRDASCMDVTSITMLLKEMGFEAGGKSDVIGITHPRNRTDSLVRFLMDQLKRCKRN